MKWAMPALVSTYTKAIAVGFIMHSVAKYVHAHAVSLAQYPCNRQSWVKKILHGCCTN